MILKKLKSILLTFLSVLYTQILYKMSVNALKIYKTYLDKYYYRWICEKVVIENFNNYELSMPFYRNRRDVIVAVKVVEDIEEFWSNLNPFATELFKTKIAGDCLVVFEDLKNDDDFNLWCEIIKRDLKKVGAKDESFNY